MKKIILLSTLLFSISFLAVADQKRKVLFIGLDGVRTDAVQMANAPTIDSLAATGTTTFNTFNPGITVSGPAWSELLCGVFDAKHGVTDNSFSGSKYNQYPFFPKRAKEIYPNINAVMVTDWAPLKDNTFNDGFNKKITCSSDVNIVASVSSTQLEDKTLDALFVHFDIVDLTGHNSGFSTLNSSYITAIESVDKAIKKIMSKLKSRPTYAEEDWLVLITTDHGGLGATHGGVSNDERQIFWIANGSAVKDTLIAGGDAGSTVTTTMDTTKYRKTPNQPDIAVTALHHLIFDSGINPQHYAKWDLDGTSWLSPSKPSTTNSINVKNAAEFRIFPNPTKDLLSIYSENINFDLKNIQLIDISGKVYNPEIIFSNNYKITLNTNSLTPGTYFVNFNSGNESFVKSFIVQ